MNVDLKKKKKHSKSNAYGKSKFTEIKSCTILTTTEAFTVSHFDEIAG